MNLKGLMILGKEVIDIKSVVTFFQIPALLTLLLGSCVVVGMLCHLFALHFPHLKNENNTSFYNLYNDEIR